MKTRSLFWGLFFITLGALYLLDNYVSFYFDWYYISDWWALIFILWGVSVIFKNNATIRPIVTGVTGFWLAVILYALFLNAFYYDYDFHFSNNNSYEVEKFSQQYEPDIENAKLIINGGAGKFSIKGATNELVVAKTYNTFGDYDFETYSSGSGEVIEITQEDTRINLIDLDYDFENKVEVKLNDNPIWDLKLNIGAAATSLDLTDYKVRRLDLNTGATKTKIKLGDLHNSTEIDVEMGAATLVFDIPEKSGCKITGDMVLIAKTLDGFSKKGNSDTYYVTDDFANAENKIYINVDGGVSSLKVKRH